MTLDPNGTASDNQRKQKLALSVQQEVVSGGRIESQSDYSAVIRFGGKPVNHVLHLILTILTLGMWSLAWLVVWILSVTSTKTITLSVDDYGNVLRQQV